MYGQTERKVTFIFLLHTWSFWANTGGFFSARSGSRYSGWSHIEAFLDILLRRASAETKESSGDVWRVKRRLNKQQRFCPSSWGQKENAEFLEENDSQTLIIEDLRFQWPLELFPESWAPDLSAWPCQGTVNVPLGWQLGLGKLGVVFSCQRAAGLQGLQNLTWKKIVYMFSGWSTRPFTILLLVTAEQVLFITFMCMCIYINIFIHTLFQLNFTSLYLVTLCNILSKQCTGDIKPVPSEMSHFSSISHLPFIPFSLWPPLLPKHNSY